ncbi:MAG: response regulator transcription factor [Solirubrobacteraceae bacterium]|jgi:DNA-binding NarL/FixJ family response regulator
MEPAASPGTLLAGDATELTTVAAPEQEGSHGGVVNEPIAPARNCPRLVIADDDPIARILLDSTLGNEFEVVGVAADSEEAIELSRVGQPDAALIDVVMPKGGGLRAVRGILEVAPDTAIVMLSGFDGDGVVRELIEAGAIAYRRKGVAPRALAEALTESIKVHTAERRESAWSILSWYCASLNRRSRAPLPRDQR